MDSEIGEGTSINIYLPVDDQTKVRKKQQDSSAGETELSGDAICVLAVDDEPDLLEVAVSYLQDLGCVVLSAAGGKQGLEVLAEHPEVDILLTDIVMPGGMNGVAFANAARERHPQLQVIYTSGFPSGVIEENANANLDAPLVSKPYNRDELGKMINRVRQRNDGHD